MPSKRAFILLMTACCLPLSVVVAPLARAEEVPAKPAETSAQSKLPAWFVSFKAAEEAAFMERDDQATELYQKSVSELEALGPSQVKPKDRKEWRENYVETVLKTAEFFKSRGKGDEAIGYYQKALEVQEQAGDATRAGTIEAMADIRCDQGDMPQAAGLYQRSISTQQQIFRTAAHAEIANTYQDFARCYVRNKQPQEAETMLQNVLAVREAVHGDQDSGILSALSELARFYTEQGRYDEAEQLYDRALAIFDNYRERKNEIYLKTLEATLPSCLEDLARVYRKTGRLTEALALEAEARRILEGLGSEAFLDK